MALADPGIHQLFGRTLSVVNVGLESMASSLRTQGTAVVDVDWRPPPDGYRCLRVTKGGVDIDQANRQICLKIRQARPVLVGLGIAAEVIPGMHRRMILHAGPPIEWEAMCGPLRGAVMGALVYEGWAKDEHEAERLAASGDVEFSPCHDHHTVGPMAGVVSPRMPVFVVENQAFGNRAFATQNEGLGRVLRYGAMGPEVYRRLRWMETDLYPILQRALDSMPDGIDIASLIAMALQMGDECHNRNRAATSLFLRAIVPSLVRTSTDTDLLARCLEFIQGNDHFFLNLSMAASKATLEPVEGVEGGSLVTVMARNGTEFGIQVACMPERWFTAPAGQVQGLYFPGYSAEDANPDIGDSTITETAGYGGFAMAAAPAITQFVGGTPEMAFAMTQEMYEITCDEHDKFTIPGLGFRGTPLGIDIRLIKRTGILPFINTGIAHRSPGEGMIGAGMLRAPKKCFDEAFDALAQMC
jgi:hypothetical protein